MDVSKLRVNDWRFDCAQSGRVPGEKEELPVTERRLARLAGLQDFSPRLE